MDDDGNEDDVDKNIFMKIRAQKKMKRIRMRRRISVSMRMRIMRGV